MALKRVAVIPSTGEEKEFEIPGVGVFTAQWDSDIGNVLVSGPADIIFEWEELANGDIELWAELEEEQYDAS